jgi:CheY-like chemotaxis protein
LRATPMRLLIAEDCGISREIVRRILHTQDHQITFASDGQEAWDTLRASPGGFDAVILDLVMPRLGGFEVLARMRASEALRGKPVILCTALGDRLSVAHAARLSVEHYIVKPYGKAVLCGKLDLVKAALDGQASGGGPGQLCGSLGIDDQARGELTDLLADDVRAWVKQSRTVSSSVTLHALLMRADALRVAALAIGEVELSRELDRAARRIEDMSADRELLPADLIGSELSCATRPVTEVLARLARRPGGQA